MTLPDERTRAVLTAHAFLRALLDPSATPRVPRSVRRRALAVLRHFPWPCHMSEAADAIPDTFGQPEEQDS